MLPFNAEMCAQSYFKMKNNCQLTSNRYQESDILNGEKPEIFVNLYADEITMNKISYNKDKNPEIKFSPKKKQLNKNRVYIGYKYNSDIGAPTPCLYYYDNNKGEWKVFFIKDKNGYEIENAQQLRNLLSNISMYTYLITIDHKLGLLTDQEYKLSMSVLQDQIDTVSSAILDKIDIKENTIQYNIDDTDKSREPIYTFNKKDGSVVKIHNVDNNPDSKDFDRTPKIEIMDTSGKIFKSLQLQYHQNEQTHPFPDVKRRNKFSEKLLKITYVDEKIIQDLINRFGEKFIKDLIEDANKLGDKPLLQNYDIDFNKDNYFKQIAKDYLCNTINSDVEKELIKQTFVHLCKNDVQLEQYEKQNQELKNTTIDINNVYLTDKQTKHSFFSLKKNHNRTIYRRKELNYIKNKMANVFVKQFYTSLTDGNQNNYMGTRSAEKIMNLKKDDMIDLMAKLIIYKNENNEYTKTNKTLNDIQEFFKKKLSFTTTEIDKNEANKSQINKIIDTLANFTTSMKDEQSTVLETEQNNRQMSIFERVNKKVTKIQGKYR